MTQIPLERLTPLLAQVRKPARYVGGEWNSVVKDWEAADVRLVLAYPDTYEIGMSNLGLAILYDLVNQRTGMIAERAYAPWLDMESVMRREKMPLFSLETHHPLHEFDVIGLSLQHELVYSNVLNMLDLANLPVLSAERTAGMPLVIAGGSCAYNPEPMAAFIDAFVIGEGEEVLIEILEQVRAWKSSPAARAKNGRLELLVRLAGIPGVYVPSLYKVSYGPDNTRATTSPRINGVPATVHKRILPTLGPAPTRPVVPNMRVVHDRGMIEIQRGCSHGCRFCQAGMIYRPIRERPVEDTLSAIDQLMASTGYPEIALVSLSSSDHSGIREIVTRAMKSHSERGLAISLPSLRIDSFSVDLAKAIQETRKTGFTFAPEAGSQRLRDVINKGVEEEDLVRTSEAVFSSGWNRVKLYFMLGLPTETDDDVIEAARLIREMQARGQRVRGRRIQINVSASTFVPKPHTPFQWVPLVDRAVLEHRQHLLREHARARGVRISWSDWDSTWLEAVLSRGDRRLGRVIHHAWRAGARFDAWSEAFRPEIWRQAFEDEDIDPVFYTTRPRDQEGVLPWDHIEVGVSKRFLWDEYQRALRGQVSPDCRETCHHCGILQAFAQERASVAGQAWGCP